MVRILFLSFMALIPFGKGDDVERRIFNGRPILITEAPYQAQIIFPELGGLFGCGGSVLSRFHILTAAHCTDKRHSIIQVRTGSSKWAEGGKVILVKKIHRHPFYDPCLRDYDVAILELESPILFSHETLPVSLSDEAPSVGKTVRVSGWGFPLIGKNHSEYLLTTRIPIIGLQECKKLYPDVFVESHKFCTYGDCGTPCIGGDGSPAMLHGLQVGIVIQGKDCISGPDVYVNIAHPLVKCFINRVVGI